MGRIPILIEGWRFLPHSYGVLNQWQILELLKRAEVELYMRDAPFAKQHWRPGRGLMAPEQEARIAALREPAPGTRIAATFRAYVPASFKPAEQGRTFVLGTADFGWMPRSMIEGRQSLSEALAGSDAVIVSPSEWSKWGLLRAGADPDRVAVVPLGVDAGVFRPGSAEERRRLRAAGRWEDSFVFLNVSAMTRSKGIDLILKAFARLAARYDHVRLCLKGTEQVYPSNRWLNRFWYQALSAEERQLCRSRLHYMGDSAPVETLANIYRAADAYVTPYRSEAFNMPALEAAACGLPIICTAGGPTDEYTTDEFARRIPASLVRWGEEPEELVREPDLEALTEAMAEAVENAAWREQARAAGPAHVRERFTWRHTVDSLLRVMTG